MVVAVAVTTVIIAVAATAATKQSRCPADAGSERRVTDAFCGRPFFFGFCRCVRHWVG
jgi:hypothetical protein